MSEISSTTAPCGATYNTDQQVDLYRSNPFIEALPDLEPERAFYKRVAQKPEINREEALKHAGETRSHYVQKLRMFFQPLPRHWTLAQSLSKLIRGGYIDRNPLGHAFERDIKERAGSINWNSLQVPSVSLRGGLLAGLSGLGKSFSVKRMLSFIPQVIRHGNYPDGRTIARDQLVWLRLECPSDASPKALCLSFFEEVDQALGESEHKYANKYSSPHLGISTLIQKLGDVASSLSLGLLVIDEIQNLCRQDVKQSASRKLLSFIVQVVNRLGVPVLMIGNSNALTLLTSELRMARRSTGLLEPHWSRFKASHPEWRNKFVKNLWDYQYLKTFTPLNTDLEQEFYRQTQGIPDIAVKLYEAIQDTLLNERGAEIITPEVIARVAKRTLAFQYPIVAALRDGDFDMLRSLPDLHPIDVFGYDCAHALHSWPRRKLNGQYAREDADVLAKHRAEMENLELPFADGSSTKRTGTYG